MPKNKLALTLAAVLFFVLAGTGVATAYWSTHATVTSNVAAGVVATTPDCGAATSLVNGGFESPDIPFNSWTRSTATQWQTGDPSGVEIWDNFQGVPAGAGNQFAEINGNFADALSQVVTTTPGQTLTWSLLHRGRSGVDGMTVLLGPPGGPAVAQASFTDGNTAWGLHSGSYVVPAGQTLTMLSLEAVSSAGGDLSYGNFVDDVKLDNGPCLLATPTVVNVSRPGQSVMVGDEIRYTTVITNMGGGSAVFSTFAPEIPAGLTYKPGTITIDGAAKTDSSGDADQANWNSSTTVTAYVGTGATSTAGGTLLPAATTTVTFTATVTSAANLGTLIFLPTVTFADSAAPTWPITASPNTLSTPFTRGPDVAVAVGTTPSPVTGSGVIYNWTFTVSNNGPGSATGVSVAVNLPTGLTVSAVTHSNPTGTCTGTGTTRTCAIGTLGAGQSSTITVSGTVLSAHSSSSMAVVATATSTTVDPTAANGTATNTAAVTDGTAPSTPGMPTVSGMTATQATLTWTASTDNVAVAGYTIYRDGTAIGTTAGPTVTYTDTTLSPSTTYSYTVRAADAAGNLSAGSGARSLTTWIAPPDGTSYYEVRSELNPGRCAQLADGTQTAVILHSCNSDVLRNWRFVPSSGGYVTINPQSATTMVWAINGTAIEIATATANTAAQEWLLIQDDDQFRIQSRSQPTMCVARASSTTIALVLCNFVAADQLWAMTVR